MPAIVVLPQLPSTQRETAAALLLEAFDAKLPPLVGSGDVGRRVLAASLDPALFLAAMAGNQLVGICGLRRRGERCLRVRWRTLHASFGWRKASISWLALALGHRALPRHALYVDQLAVAAGWRGRGIGTRLLAEAVAIVQREGRPFVLLDVVDTNPRARALYERLGFRPVVTQPAPFMLRWLGFGAVTLLRLDVGESRQRLPGNDHQRHPGSPG